MGIRNRAGNWHYRFVLNGHEWSGDTGLVATERNRNAALMAEAKARIAVREGRADQLRIVPQPFNKAADMFIEWAKGEHREKPQTWKRLRGSMASQKLFFGSAPLANVTVGRIEDYKAWRRTGTAEIAPVAEISLRHDLHALSLLFQYGIKHNWCARNLVEEVKIPSDKEAVRFHRITPAEEMAYFEAAARIAPDLHDVAKLMLLQGPRPSEVMAAHVSHVDLAGGAWRIPDSKSAAGKRTLYLRAESREIMARRIAAAPPSGWLFEGKRKGTHLHDIENSHLAVLDATGLRFVLYDWRHNFATRAAEAGMDVATLAAILGHANLRTVMRYVHIGQEHVREAMKRLDGVAAPAPAAEAKERVQ